MFAFSNDASVCLLAHENYVEDSQPCIIIKELDLPVWTNLLIICRCSDAYSDTILGYANSIRTIDGGTHIDGFKTSLTRTLNSLAKKSKANKVY